MAPTGLALGDDDHRDRHEHELERRLAARSATKLTKVLDETSCKQVVMVAGPHMLGILRAATGTFAVRGVEIHDVALDLNTQTTSQLHDHLAGIGAIPPPQRAGV